MYKRYLESVLARKSGSGKAIIVIGPRQVGKTTLINHFLEGKEFLFLDCDDPSVRAVLTDINTEELKRIIGNNKLVFID